MGSSHWADKAVPASVGHPVVSTVADPGIPSLKVFESTSEECPAHPTGGRTERELPPLRAGKPRMEEAKG